MKSNEVRKPFRILAGIIAALCIPVSLMSLYIGIYDIYENGSSREFFAGIGMVLFALAMFLIAKYGKLPRKFLWLLGITNSSLKNK